MSRIQQRVTSHTIEGNIIDFTVYMPTVGDPTTRRMTVTDPDGKTVVVEFEYEGFELFKALVNEY